jgi:hypothetical protein
MVFQIVGRERSETFAPRLEGRCPFLPYKDVYRFTV